MNNSAIAEILESCCTEVRAQCRELGNSPPLGSIIRIDSQPKCFALVYQISTRCIDPGRSPIAYGKSAEELRMEQPQIFELLKTEFKAILIGHQEDGRYLPILPPQPPHIHSFAYPAESVETKELTASPEYLRRLLSASLPDVDELIVACTRHLMGIHGDNNTFLLQVGQELASLISEDYERLKALLRRITA